MVTRMGGFSILTNRKRAIVALVHSVVFLMIAVRQIIAAQPAAGIWVASTVSRGTWILCGIFTLVSAILLWLLVISRGWMEKIYFGLCTVSASSGLLRTAAGDRAFHAGLYIRVVMLVSAVLVGLLIVRVHSSTHARVSSEDAEGRHSSHEGYKNNCWQPIRGQLTLIESCEVRGQGSWTRTTPWAHFRGALRSLGGI